MHAVSSYPALVDAPALTGHLWLQERVTGTRLRVQLRDDAHLRFGDDVRQFDAEEAPRHLRFGVHAVVRRLDRAALRDAVDDVESVTLVGTAPHARGVDYDWGRLPGFLGTDVWSADADDWLPPDRAEQVFESLGLDPVNALAKEVRAADFHPDRYDFPDSAWRDGPVAGVLVRSKTGDRAVLENPAVTHGDPAEAAEDATPEAAADAAEMADRFATDARFERTAAAIEAEYGGVSFDALQARVLDAIYREHAPVFDRVAVDHDAFRRAVAARTSTYLGSG
jgi:hypothetical protein